MKSLISIFCFLITSVIIHAQGNVYFVLGSDTAIWDVMDVAKYNCTYNYNVIPDKTRNFYKVMQPEYRNKFSDSYGNKLKLTWWLMSGNIFRYATNKNIPFPNMIVPYSAQKYYGNVFAQFKDELSLHYHTFAWTDYDGDGRFWWNQAKNFIECKSDFYFTVAQMLLEENIFPVSFRSGWNTMDNEWQAELDKLLPYSMHNEAPSYRVDTSEPYDNNFDWRLASKEFIPYRPSSQNYQLNGNGHGWNLHSRYAGSVSQAEMNSIFVKAKTKDQVVCLWGHVWDDTFPEYVLRIDSLAKAAVAANPTVKFRYCTAVEGMQFWRKSEDTIPPEATLSEITIGDEVKYKLQTDEPIFQVQPFVAVKTIDESFNVIDFNKTGQNEWTSINSYDKKNIAKIGFAVTDTLGNLKKQIINYVQDDIYVDNEDKDYIELHGNWTTESKAAWGLDSRKSSLKANDSSKVRWNFKITSPHYYNIFVQLPKNDQACKEMLFRVYGNNKLLDTVVFKDSISRMEWVYISTQYLNPSNNNYVELVAKGNGQESKILSADVVKITPLVRQRWILVQLKTVDLGFVIKKDSVKSSISISNHGIENLTITSITSKNNMAFTKTAFPIVIPKFGRISLPFYFISDDLGLMSDTLFIKSDDPAKSVLSVAINAEVTNYFKLADNDETSNYIEHGVWNKSVAQAFGSSSRYATLNQSPKAYAVFTLSVKENGFYDVMFIVPKTENASNKALYIIQQGNKISDSVIVDQNYNSGKWITIKNCELINSAPVKITIMDNGKATVGTVLRTDAVKLSYTGSTSYYNEIPFVPTEYELFQNYPNPFNPVTKIKFGLPETSQTKLIIYDVLGREVSTLINGKLSSGYHEVEFSAGELSSGIYFYRLTASKFTEIKKMILVK